MANNQWNQQTRLWYDMPTKTVEEMQSEKPGQYQIFTPGYRFCENRQQYAEYMDQGLAHGQAVYRNSCSVADENQLRFGKLTDMRYRHQVNARPYGGAFMGAGQPSLDNKDLESRLFYGLDTRGGPRKACDVSAGVSIDRFIPLPEYGNPQRVQHVVEPWVRGGEHTRDYVRRVNYEREVLGMKE